MVCIFGVVFWCFSGGILSVLGIGSQLGFPYLWGRFIPKSGGIWRNLDYFPKIQTDLAVFGGVFPTESRLL
jgi:hypothetical protein